jgi:hypothetical protein
LFIDFPGSGAAVECWTANAGSAKPKPATGGIGIEWESAAGRYVECS